MKLFSIENPRAKVATDVLVIMILMLLAIPVIADGPFAEILDIDDDGDASEYKFIMKARVVHLKNVEMQYWIGVYDQPGCSGTKIYGESVFFITEYEDNIATLHFPSLPITGLRGNYYVKAQVSKRVSDTAMATKCYSGLVSLSEPTNMTVISKGALVVP